MSELHDRVYILTGGGGAVAGAVARVFSAHGARRVLGDRREGPTRDLAGFAVRASVDTLEDAQAVVRAAKARYGRIDGVICAAGAFQWGRVQDAGMDTYDRMFDANMRTVFCAVSAVLPDLTDQGSGFIAGFSSMPAWHGAGSGVALYAASKAAVATFLRSLDAELIGTDIRVASAVPLGVIDTPANQSDMPDADPRDWIDADEVAQALLFAATRGPRARLVELPIYPRR